MGDLTRVVEHAPAARIELAPDPVLAMVERASRDPAVDISKMERLWQMHKEHLADEAKRTYFAALSEMQDELSVVVERGEIKDNSGNVRSRYALWEDVNKQIKPVLKKYGFALLFTLTTGENKIIVSGSLVHKAGHQIATEIPLPSDDSGSKNKVQAIGSSVSYGKRYVAFMLLNLTSGESDDDGVLAGGSSEYIEWSSRIAEATKENIAGLGGEISKAKLSVEDKARLRKLYADRKRALEEF